MSTSLPFEICIMSIYNKYNKWYTVYNRQYTMSIYNIQCTIYNVQYTIYNINSQYTISEQYQHF